MDPPNSRRSLQLINPSAMPYVALTPTLVSPHEPSWNNRPSCQLDLNSTRQHDKYYDDEYRHQPKLSANHHHPSFPPSNQHHSNILDLSSSSIIHKQNDTLFIHASPSLSRLASSSPSSSPDLSSRPILAFGHHTHHWQHFSERRPLLAFSIRLLSILLCSALLLFALVWFLLPPLDSKDLPTLRIPTSFDALKKLNALLQIYKTENYHRVLGSFVLIYLFLQAFSLPGSMYLSILAGAMFGVQVALPLVSLCVGTGAMLSYLMSLHLAQGLVMHSSCLRNRLDDWKIKLSSKTNKCDLFSYLVVIRISPLPPHWVVNLLAPHVGIQLSMFWFTTCIGILPVTLIHTQLGTTLDQMVGPEDLSFLTTKNLAGLSLVAIGVMIPVLIRWYLKKDLEDLPCNHSTNTVEPRPFSTRSVGLRLESSNNLQDLTLTTPRRTNHRLRNPSSQTLENLLSNTTADSSFSSLNKLTTLDSTETLLLSSHHHHASSTPPCLLKNLSSHHQPPYGLFTRATVVKSNHLLINGDADDDKTLLLDTKHDSMGGQHHHQDTHRLVLEDEDLEDESLEQIHFKRNSNRSSPLPSSTTTHHHHQSQRQHHHSVKI